MLTLNRSSWARPALRVCVSVSHYCNRVGRSILTVLLVIVAIVLEEEVIVVGKEKTKAAG
jgi:hypothetical protein